MSAAAEFRTKASKKNNCKRTSRYSFLVVFPIFHWLVKFCANPACSTLAMILQIFLLWKKIMFGKSMQPDPKQCEGQMTIHRMRIKSCNACLIWFRKGDALILGNRTWFQKQKMFCLKEFWTKGTDLNRTWDTASPHAHPTVHTIRDVIDKLSKTVALLKNNTFIVRKHRPVSIYW